MSLRTQAQLREVLNQWEKGQELALLSQHQIETIVDLATAANHRELPIGLVRFGGVTPTNRSGTSTSTTNLPNPSAL